MNKDISKQKYIIYCDILYIYILYNNYKIYNKYIYICIR